MWVWTSIAPGMTYLPRASIVSSTAAMSRPRVEVGGGEKKGRGVAGLLGGFVVPGARLGVGAGACGAVGLGVGVAGTFTASSPTIALRWMLRSWFRAPALSRLRVRMCHGAPDTVDAPSRAPPAALSQ